MPHSKFSPCRSPAGFTLIELLLALVMFAAIAGVVFASFAAIADGVDKGRQSADVYRVGRGAMQRLIQEISTAVWFENDPRTALLGEDGEESGQPRDRLTFVTIPYRHFSETVPENELCDVSYFLDQNAQDKSALFRTEDCTLDEERQDDGTRLELTDLAVGLDITYYDAEGDHESWPPNQDEQGPLPCQVRVALTLRDAQQYERVFITMVSIVMRGACEDKEAER
jgi:type II secretion system protein J